MPMKEPQLAQAMVWDEPLRVVMRADHPLSARPVPAWSDLATQRLLWYDAGCAPGYAEEIPAQLAALGWSPRLHPLDHDQQALFVHALQSTPDLIALRSVEAVADHPQLMWRPLPTPPPRERLALTALAGSRQARLLRTIAARMDWPVLP
ncbi:hypothetical protein GXW82_06685 [Streptacidiphilus sp. 4-A2]|nr:hypothetical protein [Streptacidiphilus sp. 4-A2]